MQMNRREFLAASVAGAAMMQPGMAAFAAPAGSIEVAIDAGKIGEPVTPLIFGGYMEPATTRVWAEMLNDRKFAHAITNAAPPKVNSFFRRFMGQPWKPVGPEGSVKMDTARPFVGAQSPRIQLDGSAPRGIQQSGLRMAGGRLMKAGSISKAVPAQKLKFAWCGEPRREMRRLFLSRRFPMSTRNFR